MPKPAAGPRFRRWDHWPAVALATSAALVALWARHRLFPAYSWNRDEPVYLWHVDALRAGRLTPTDGGYPSLFQPWLSARGDGVLFTQYTLGWPLVLLAATTLTGGAGSALLLGAALAVVGTYVIGLELLRDRRSATLGAGLMVASPILPIQGGAYLSYLFTLGLGLIAGALILSGIRLGRPLRLAAAGLTLGWIFLTRPYDAVIWGVTFGMCTLLRERARWAAALKLLLLAVVAALPLVLATLAYNRHVTGAWLEFPITAADPKDTFGFGHRRLMPTFEVVDYDLGKAVKATAKNAFLLPWFLVGSYVGLFAAGLGLWQRRRDPATLALALLIAAFPAGYFVFWGNHLSSMAARISGPIYFVPLYAPLCLLIASVIVDWWPQHRRAAYSLIAALIVGTLPAAVTRFGVNRDISLEQAAWRESVEGLEGEALVFVADTAPYLLYLNPFSSNGPRLDDRILYASDSGPAMLDLIADMPDRRPYLQQGTVAAQDSGPRENPADLDVNLSAIEVRRGRTLTLRVTAARLDPGRVADLEIATGADFLSKPILSDGQVVEVDLLQREGADGLLIAQRGTVSITLDEGSTRARVDLVYRVVDGSIEVLLPSATYRYVRVEGGRDWRRTVTLEELTVDVRQP